MKNVLGKEFLREILKNKGRFLSIFFIVLLGAAFFSGIRATGGDMKETADRYYDETLMMDIRVLSTLGLTEEDLQDMAALPDVELVQGGRTMDVLIREKPREMAVKLIAATEEVNRLNLVEGRAPETMQECVVDDRFMKQRGYQIGDSIQIYSGTEDPLEDSLKMDCFTIVGSGNLPYYMDLTRGVGSIGDGSLSGFLVVSPEVFDLEVYTEAYIRVADVLELNCYGDEYQDKIASVVDELEDLADSCEQRRYDKLRTEAEDKIADGKQELEDAKQELADAKQELDDGKEKLDDGKEELADAKQELKDGKAELDDAKQQLADAEKELTDGKVTLDQSEKELADGAQQIADGEKELRAAEEKLKAGRAELDQAAEELAKAEAELKAAKEQLDASASELENGKKELEEKTAQLSAGRAELENQDAILTEKEQEALAGWAQYQQGMATLEMMKSMLPADDPSVLALEAQLSAAYEQLTAGDALLAAARSELETQRGILEQGEQQLAEGWAAYEAGQAQYEAGLAQYQAGLAEYEAGLEKYRQGEAEWAAGKAEYEAGKAKLEAAKETYNSGKQAWEDGKKTWEEGQKEYQDGLQKYNDGLADYKEGKKAYKEGKEEYEENLKKWEDGMAEYLEAEEDALPEIADAEKELADAEQKVRDLKKPTWYVLDRDKIQSCVSYGMDAERMDKLGNVFPVLFFLVAALVSLTAMTRMVEEQRQQIGTMKALGYGGITIATKYFGYAMLATVTGAIIGVLIGEKFLPWVIMISYCMLYTGLPQIYASYDLVQGSLAVVLSALCTGGATLAACMRKLMESPASLMRPEAPKSGKRILLERIPFLWKRFNFTRKATLRNLFRYKKRFIMTIIGIGGCMGLMLVGFGIRDSITVVAKNQFVEIFMQEASVSVDTDASEEDTAHLLQTIEHMDGVTGWMEVNLEAVTLNANNTDRTAYLYVPREVDRVTDFVRFRDRTSKASYDFPTEGVALAEKTADMMDVKVGDTITIKKGDNGEPVETVVTVIVENYVQHYAFLTPETYETLFGEPVKYNYVYVNYEDNSEDTEAAFGKTLLNEEACTGVNFTTTQESSIEDMLQALFLVIWVLIGAAALLAFVVLYNLNSINMTERKRELATLKVLGFYDPEVAMYVYRENILLTVLGILAGAFLGKFLHLFTILTVEVDLMMFGRVIEWQSYLICALLTAVFSVVVNLIMYVHFKKIDMIESLKSVE